MDADRFETLLRAIPHSPSRRGALRVLVGAFAAVLPVLARSPAGAKKGRNKRGKKGKKVQRKVTICHQGQTKRVARSAVKIHRNHGDTMGACPIPPNLVSIYQCSGVGGAIESALGNARLAQTFTPSQNGTLRQIRFEIFKDPPPTTPGDYVVQLLAVSGGVPGETFADILAQVNIPDAAVPVGDFTLIADFPSGPVLSTTDEFAAAITRPASNGISVRTQGDGGVRCAGEGFFSNGGSFNLFSPPGDLAVEVLIV